MQQSVFKGHIAPGLARGMQANQRSYCVRAILFTPPPDLKYGKPDFKKEESGLITTLSLKDHVNRTGWTPTFI